MHRTSNAFSVLQATAAIVGLAILLWSFGLPSLRFAEAANVTSFSDTLSTSAPGVVANHTIQFTTPTGVANGASLVMTFANGPFVVGSVDYTDIDVATTSDFTLAADCNGSENASAAFSGTTLTITFCAGDGGSIPASGTTTIEIGLNASAGVAGNAQLVNPAVGSYELSLTAGASDFGDTRVAIVDNVTVSASVDTLFNFSVSGVGTGNNVNGTTTGGVSTGTLIPFGTLDAGVASTAAQDLTVVTNARGGFVVTVQAGSQLVSANGADIDGFIDGAYTDTPTAWQAPGNTPGSENSYGHWGITSDDSDYFASGQYVSASTTPRTVFSHSGPTNGSGVGEGTTRVGYTAQISPLQEAADDYTATLTYVATPVF